MVTNQRKKNARFFRFRLGGQPLASVIEELFKLSSKVQGQIIIPGFGRCQEFLVQVRKYTTKLSASNIIRRV